MIEPDFEPLRNYLKTLDVDDKAAYANASGTSLGYLNKACSTKPLMDGALCRRLDENSFGKVPKQKLRPDIWPDLVVEGDSTLLNKEKAA